MILYANRVKKICLGSDRLLQVALVGNSLTGIRAANDTLINFDQMKYEGCWMGKKR
jgi:hypothetical protein